MPLCLRAATTGESTSSILTPVCEVVLPHSLPPPPPPQTLRVILSALVNIFKKAGPGTHLIATQIEEAGGLDKIEGLQQHREQHVHRLAYEITDKYFTAEVQVHCMLTTITLFRTIFPSFTSLPPGLIRQVRCFSVGTPVWPHYQHT